MKVSEISHVIFRLLDIVTCSAMVINSLFLRGNIIAKSTFVRKSFQMYAYVMTLQCMLFSKRLTAKLTVKPFFCIVHFSHMTI